MSRRRLWTSMFSWLWKNKASPKPQNMTNGKSSALWNIWMRMITSRLIRANKYSKASPRPNYNPKILRARNNSLSGTVHCQRSETIPKRLAILTFTRIHRDIRISRCVPWVTADKLREITVSINLKITTIVSGETLSSRRNLWQCLQVSIWTNQWNT